MDIHLISCCTSGLVARTSNQLVPIWIPLEKIGQMAATRLLELMNGESSDSALFDANSLEKVWPQPFIQLDNATPVAQSKAKDDASATPKFVLTPRELECLQWASKGKTAWETSQILAVSESTVIFHLRNATRKLNATNRVHAVTKALQASLIEF